MSKVFKGGPRAHLPDALSDVMSHFMRVTRVSSANDQGGYSVQQAAVFLLGQLQT